METFLELPRQNCYYIYNTYILDSQARLEN